MLWELIRKELHSSIITARFIVGFVICLMLISASTYVAIRDYERRLNDYNVASREHRDEILRFRTYSQLVLRVDRRPGQLSIFSQGMDKHLGNTFSIRAPIVPAIYDGGKHGAHNPFLALFPSIDLTFIFQVVLSLLALLCAYDAVSGERENGTLKLMMSNSIPRSYVLLGKYLSALLLLSWPIAVSIIFALLMVMFSGSISLNASHLLRVLLIVIVSLLYVSLFFLIGLFISVKTRRTATSLMLAMFVWVFLNLVYPVDVILGKFVGAFASIILPLSLAIILNLLIISLSGTIELDWSHWGRIGMVLLASVIYIAIFICLGMLVSATSSRSSTSLLVLLLIWTVFVVLMPNILGSICSDLKKVPSPDEVSRRKEKAKDDLWEKYASKELFWSSSPAPTRENPDMKLLRLWAEYLTGERQTEERITDEHLDAQLAQIHLARQITRISPTAIYRYVLESMSNTGFERHRDFIANVRMHRNIFWEYIKSEDQRDPDSLHVYFVREGLSNKPASFDAAPRFTENLSLAGSLHDALLDIAILTLFAVLFFMATYISFLRRDIR